MRVRTDQELGLLRNIRENPEDDTARLVYADYLDEIGEGPRAELIRTQIELVRVGPAHKKTAYPEEAIALKSLGDRHYRFTGHTSERFAVGDRVDLLVQRPLKKSKMVYGFRVYKVEPCTRSYELDAVDVYVRLDDLSGPWKGIELEAKSKVLVDTNQDRWWKGPMCVACGGSGTYTWPAEDGGSPPMQCPDCFGTGDAGGLPWRVHLDDPEDGLSPVDVRTPVTVEYVRGMKRVECRAADVWEGVPPPFLNGGFATYRPTPWALAVCRHHPDVVEFWPVDVSCVMDEGGYEWYNLPDPLNVPELKATFETADEGKVALGRYLVKWVHSHIK